MKPVVLVCVLLLTGCSKGGDAPAPVAAGEPQSIAWVRPASATDIDAAFATAKANRQPVFLFWSASWCPPCNQVKSTVFTRPEFIAKTRTFVPIYVDGDKPGGQALGKRFKVSAYPTMVLLNAEREEITRLAGSVEPNRYLQLLDLGIGSNPAKQSLDAALGGRPLAASEWRLLAYHAWATDDQQLVAQADAPAVLMKLATTCPPAERESAARLVLQALAAAASANPEERPALDLADAQASIESLLAQPELVREHHDLFTHAADDIVALLTTANSAERKALSAAWVAALERLADERALSNAARVWIASAKVNLARLDNKDALPDGLLAEARAVAARADQETTDLDERQSVITSAGGMLSRAGLHDDADRLLRAELTRSHSPYYYMLGLALNERRRATAAGRAAAIDWARQAYESATGPATRIEWGASYLRYLIDLAPEDAQRIEKVAIRVVGELPAQPGAFAGRSQRVLERTSERLVKWSDGRHGAVLARVNATLAERCAQATLDAADRAACEGLFAPTRRG
jgi:thioredoxin-related protein